MLILANYNRTREYRFSSGIGKLSSALLNFISGHQWTGFISGLLKFSSAMVKNSSAMVNCSSALVKIYQWTGTAAFDPSSTP